jgi:hypothetical protein
MQRVTKYILHLFRKGLEILPAAADPDEGLGVS